MFEIGSSLREARVRQGYDFPEIEQATKVRAKYLRALEDEQFDVLPAETYVKGFLRTYAEYLGLDGQLYVDEFNSRHAVGEDEPPPVRRPSTIGRPRRSVSWPLVATLVGIAAVIALVVAAVRTGNDSGSLPTPPPPPAAKKHPPPPPAPKRHKRTSASVVLAATRDSSWVKAVALPSGKELYEGTIEKGTFQVFHGKRLLLNVGRPPALKWKINGKVRKPPSQLSGIFIVTKNGLRPAPSGV